VISKKFILFMDILIVLALLFHFGALGISNFMIAKKTIDSGKELIFVEANPVASATHDFVAPPTPEAKVRGISKMAGLIFEAMSIAFVLSIYIFYRIKAKKTEKSLYIWRYIFIVTMFLIVSLTDFIYDFGFLIGKLVFG